MLVCMKTLVYVINHPISPISFNHRRFNGMVEKWDPVLGPRDPGNPGIS